MDCKLLILLALISVSSLNAQYLEIETDNASCNQVCDGRMTLLGMDSSGDIHYEWKSENELKYKPLREASLNNICNGRYDLRIVGPLEINHEQSKLKAALKSGFVHLKTFELNSVGLRNITFSFILEADIDDPSHFITAYFSNTAGSMWHNAGRVVQKGKVEANGKMRYQIELPSRAENWEKVHIDIQMRNPKKRSGNPMMNLIDFKVIGYTQQLMKFDIGLDKNMEVRSVVSNEAEGADGYIELSVRGGNGPYSYLWSDGSKQSYLRGLSPGMYDVKITDRMGCIETGQYKVMKAMHDQEGSFAFSEAKEQVYTMVISELYRQPLQLALVSKTGEVVKSYKINPLYEDLKMSLDLSFLTTGDYSAELSGTEFREKVGFRID